MGNIILAIIELAVVLAAVVLMWQEDPDRAIIEERLRKYAQRTGPDVRRTGPAARTAAAHLKGVGRVLRVMLGL